MKKLTSLIFSVFVFLSSCQEDHEISPSNSFEDELAVLSEMNETGFNFVTIKFDQNLILYDDFEIGLNQRQFVNDILQGLNGQFFVANESFISEFQINMEN